MIKAVLDTNVIVSGIIRRHPDAPAVQILDAWREAVFQLVVCDEILDEVSRTLHKPYFARRLTSSQTERALLLLRRYTFRTPLTSNIHGVASHPEDDAIIDAAISAHADVLVTGDLELQALGGFEGVAIISPRSFLDVLRGAAQ